MYQKDDRSFEEKLELGNVQEDKLVEILNWCGVPAIRNNSDIVTDIDVVLTKDNMFVDSKLIETPFYKAKQYTGIDPDKCLPINVKHVRTYQRKEQLTGKRCWVAFFVDFPDFNVHELIFVPNSQLVYLIDNHPGSVANNKLNFDRTIGRDLHSFLDYLKKVRKVNNLNI